MTHFSFKWQNEHIPSLFSDNVEIAKLGFFQRFCQIKGFPEEGPLVPVCFKRCPVKCFCLWMQVCASWWIKWMILQEKSKPLIVMMSSSWRPSLYSVAWAFRTRRCMKRSRELWLNKRSRLRWVSMHISREWTEKWSDAME